MLNCRTTMNDSELIAIGLSQLTLSAFDSRVETQMTALRIIQNQYIQLYSVVLPKFCSSFGKSGLSRRLFGYAAAEPMEQVMIKSDELSQTQLLETHAFSFAQLKAKQKCTFG